jgi:hypothetical protein
MEMTKCKTVTLYPRSEEMPFIELIRKEAEELEKEEMKDG